MNSNAPVLLAIATSRASLFNTGKKPPYMVSLSVSRGKALRNELEVLGCAFGIPFDGFVPEPKEDGEWTYFGIVLEDVHVYARVR